MSEENKPQYRNFKKFFTDAMGEYAVFTCTFDLNVLKDEKIDPNLSMEQAGREIVAKHYQTEEFQVMACYGEIVTNFLIVRVRVDKDKVAPFFKYLENYCNN
jgi:hypothetical protein